MRTETDIKKVGQADITDKRLMQQLKREEIDRNNRPFIYLHDIRLGLNMPVRVDAPTDRDIQTTGLMMITMDINYQNIIK